MKATEMAAQFMDAFDTRSFPAVEHRIYKLRREGEVKPRRSTMLAIAPALKLLTGQSDGRNPHNFVLRSPDGSTFIGTREQVIELLSRSS